MTQETPGLVPRMTGGRITGLAIGIILLLFGTGWWFVYITITGQGYSTDEGNVQFIQLGFALWFFPWLAGLIASLFALGARRLSSKILSAIGGILLITAIVTSIVGAQ